MNRYRIIISLLLIIQHIISQGQEHYTVKRVNFSTNRSDEFSPVILGNKIVFCSNREDEKSRTNSERDKKGLFNIFSIQKQDSSNSYKPELFSSNLISPYNDGPVTFDTSGNTIVYSRNVDIKSITKEIFDRNNNLGLYIATLDKGEWTNIKPFRYNNEKYSTTTPWLSPDGKYLYFASDMPGGYGGTDLYRSEYVNEDWTEPENLGEIINTKGNELYPSVNSAGELFFASDGHPGLGKKDIFLSIETENGWIKPVHLDSPINSKDDDFSLITDNAFTSGYFASNRNSSDDIFEFETLIPQLYNCDTLKKNQYCFEFWDDKFPGLDTLPVIYEWEFSDGVKLRGLVVQHCLPGTGSYKAKLNIIDNSTSNTFFTQSSMEFEISDFEQPYISSRDAFLIKELMEFDGLSSNLPGFKIEEYIWDFGDGSFTTGAQVNHTYNRSGVYGVKLGVSGYYEAYKEKGKKCVIKPIAIKSDNQSLAMYLAGIESAKADEGPDDAKRDTSKINQDFSLFDVNPEENVFRVEVLSSEKKIMLTDTIFNQLRNVYEIKEYYLKDDSIYSYTVGEYSSLLSSYGVYKDIVNRGFTSAKVKTYILAELPTEVVTKINLDFAKLANANFEFSQSELSENSYEILDKIVKILKDNPDLAMEIAAHTDNTGSFEFNAALSQKRAESIVNYLVSKGIDKLRLVGKGYGESRPISSNSTEEGRMKNRRVEFLILNK